MNLNSLKRNEQSLVKPLSVRLKEMQDLLEPMSGGMMSDEVIKE